MGTPLGPVPGSASSSSSPVDYPGDHQAKGFPRLRNRRAR